MAKCSACGRFITQADGVNCSTCPSIYHHGCLGLSKTSKIGKSWACPECCKDKPRDNKTETPVKTIVVQSPPKDSSPIAVEDCRSNANSKKTPGNLDLGMEIKLFRGEMRALQEEIKLMRQDMQDLRSTITINNSRIDSLEGRVETLERNYNDRNNTAAHLETIISQLRIELNEKDQELLTNDLEITNLNESPGENPLHLVSLIASKLGVVIEERDIVCAERVGLRPHRRGRSGAGDSSDTVTGGSVAGAGRPRPLVVRLARRAQRDDILRSMRVRRGASSADFGLVGEARPFYINERLTKFNRQLLYKVREARRRMQWKYLWTKRGRIFVRQDDGKTPYNIRSENDLMRVFGNECVSGLNQ